MLLEEDEETGARAVEDESLLRVEIGQSIYL